MLAVPLALVGAGPAAAAGFAFITDATVVEGTGGTNSLNFNVTVLGLGGGQCAFLQANTADNTAVAPGDYTATNTPMFFNANGTQSISVPIVTDNIDEPTEAFLVNLVDLVGPCGVTPFSDSQAVGTITDDDAAPTINIGDRSLAEGTGGPGFTNFNFFVNLTNPSSVQTSVDYALSLSGSANISDVCNFGPCSPFSGTLVFAPGVVSQTATISVLADATNEANETFFVNLSNPQATVGGFTPSIGDGSGLGIIVNDDAAGTLNITDATGTEGGPDATFTINLSSASSSATTVQYSTGPGTAASPGDFTAVVNGIATIPAFATSTTVTINIVDDAITEPSETFFVTLSNPTNNAAIGDGQGEGTINDNDSVPSVSLTPVNPNANEGNAGSTTIPVTVQLSNVSTQNVVVSYEIVNCGTCGASSATAGSDFQGVAFAQVTVPAGQTTATIPVVVFGDGIPERSEFLQVNITSATNATVGTATQFPLIHNDDNLPNVTIGDLLNITEGNAGTSIASFPVTLSTAQQNTTQVGFSTSNGAALAGQDFVGASGSINIPGGSTNGTINITINGDVNQELNENFFVNLTSLCAFEPIFFNNFGGCSPAGTITDGQGQGIIINDDAPAPVLNVADVTVTEGNGGTVTANFVVSLTTLSNVPVTFNASTASSSATAPSDFTALVNQPFTIPANVGSINVPVTVNGDTTFEISEAFLLNISSIVNANGGDTQAVGTITNDDFPTITVNDPVVTEGTGAGTTNANFILTLDGAAQVAGSVQVSLAPISASAPSDYSAAGFPQTVNFAVGETTKTVSVSVNRDNVTEGDETFALNIGAPVNIVIGDPQGIGTILNDDSLPSPTVTGLAPNNGPSQGGTQVTIVGTNLTNATQVTIGGTPVAFFVSGPNLVFTTPFGFPGATCVQVTNPGGTSPCVPGSTFTYV